MTFPIASSSTSSELHDNVLHRPPPTFISPYFAVRSTPYSGQSLFSTSKIPASTVIHTSGPPFCSTVMSAYRKECCAHCFKLVDKGNWSVREQAKKFSVRWFCGENCHSRWRQSLGDIGIQAAVACEEVIRRNRMNAAQSDANQSPAASLSHGAVTLDEALEAWMASSTLGDEICQLRITAAADGGKAAQKALRRAEMSMGHLAEEDDEDVLRLLVDGVSRRYQAHLMQKDVESGLRSHGPQGNVSWNDLRSLVPTLSFYSHSQTGREALRSYIRMYHSLLFHLPIPLLTYWTPESILTILSRDSGNSFGIWEDLGQIRSQDTVPPISPTSAAYKGVRGPLLAYAIYPSSSYFNHCCAPNIAKSLAGTGEWTFTTTKDIEEGDELCISYLGGGEGEGWESRRNVLKLGWGFDCACWKCVQDQTPVGVPSGTS